MINTPDRYDIEARYVPALVCSVPFLFFGYFFLNGLDGAFWHSVLTLTVGSLGLSTALFLLGVHFFRLLGNAIQEKVFCGGLALPTTKFLLKNDFNLSEGYKTKIRSKIKTKFGIDLSNAQKDSDENRRAIHEAVGQIRSLFYRKNHLVQQRNIQFGLMRNLLAGSIVSIMASITGFILSFLTGNDPAIKVASALLGVYVLLVIVCCVLLKFSARQYALTLYSEFLAIRS